jgi:hypothetical protein
MVWVSRKGGLGGDLISLELPRGAKIWPSRASSRASRGNADSSRVYGWTGEQAHSNTSKVFLTIQVVIDVAVFEVAPTPTWVLISG